MVDKAAAQTPVVAQAYGDDNRLWSDEDYAKDTRWREPVAPPAMVGGDTLIGEDDPVEITDALEVVSVWGHPDEDEVPRAWAEKREPNWVAPTAEGTPR